MLRTHLVLVLALVLDGPVATVVGGTLVGTGHARWPVVLLLAVLVDVACDAALFAVGRLGRREQVWTAVEPLLTRVGLGPERREGLARRARERVGTLVVGAKVLDAGAVPAFLAAGWSGVGFGRFLAWTSGASLVRAGVLLAAGLALGVQFARRLQEFTASPWRVLLAGLAVGAVLLALRALLRRLRRTR